MSGFESGNSQGIRTTGKQSGAILRGFGPPVPGTGDLGDVYIDVTTYQLFEKRNNGADGGVDPWGHYLFVVPVAFQAGLKYFGAVPPSNSIGAAGDYYLQWGGYPNYGMSPIIYGPKTWTGWASNGDGPGTVIASGAGATVLPVGLLAEGTSLLDKALSQLLAIGLLAEYVIPIPITANDGETVLQLGLAATGVAISITPNPLYTAEDEYTL